MFEVTKRSTDFNEVWDETPMRLCAFSDFSWKIHKNPQKGRRQCVQSVAFISTCNLFFIAADILDYNLVSANLTGRAQ